MSPQSLWSVPVLVPVLSRHLPLFDPLFSSGQTHREPNNYRDLTGLTGTLPAAEKRIRNA